MAWLDMMRTVLSGLICVWLWASLFIHNARKTGDEPKAIFVRIKSEMKPFVPLLALGNLFGDLVMEHLLIAKIESIILCVLSLFLYVTDKDEDDRWKRRRKRAAGKIKSLGHKLVVAPVQG